MKFLNIAKKNISLIYGSLFVIFFFRLLYMFPYTGDDWAWGSKIGLERLSNFFSNYNGRYLGNLLVLPLTRSVIFKSIVITIALLAIVLLTLAFMENKRNKTLFIFLSGLCLVFMPRGLLAQGLVWTSGFANYVPPIILILGYIVFCKRFLENTYFKIHPLWNVLMFILGFAASLFMEHVTMYNLILSLIILGFVFLRFKRIYLVNILYAVGSLIGTITMFTNSSYHEIFLGEYVGRTIGGANIGNVISTHLLCQTYKDLIANNIIINIILTLILILIIAYSIFSGRNVIIGFILSGYMIIYCIATSIFYFSYVTKNFTLIYVDNKINGLDITFFILTIIFYIALIVTVLLFIDDYKVGIKSLLLLVSILLLTIPLLIVNPIGPRCFLPMYILFIVLIGVLLDQIKLMDRTTNILLIVISVFAIIGMIRLYTIYTPIYKTTRLRNYVQELQVKEHKQIIEIPDNPPNGGWTNVWAWSPLSYWEYRYKMFYNIPQQDNLKVVPYGEWIKTYGKYENQI